MKIGRGQIVIVDLDPVVGSEQGKRRPAVVIQNDVGNRYSNTTIIALITSKVFSREFMTNVEVSAKRSGLDKNSTILLNQIRTIDKHRIVKTLHRLDIYIMDKVDSAIRASLGLV